jgi:hypothetical protein
MSRGSRPRGAIISAYEDEGLTHIFWWTGVFAVVATVGAVLSIVDPGWIDLAVGTRDSLRGAEWMVAGAHLVVAVFLAAIARLEWRSAFPRRQSTDRSVTESP